MKQTERIDVNEISASAPLGRQWARVNRVKLIGATADETRFDADGESLTVTAIRPGVFRLVYGEASGADYDLLPGGDHRQELRLSTHTAGWRMHSGDSTLEIDAESFRLRLVKDNRVVLESVTDEHFRGYTRLPSLARHRTGAARCLSFALRSEEGVYGLGEKFGALDRRGQLITGRIEDALGVNTELSYKNIPFCWSPTGWGVMFHTPAVITHAVGYAQWSHRTYCAVVEDAALDFLLFAGDPVEILENYTHLTGMPAMPPLWSLGVWLSRCYYQTPEEAASVAAKVRARGMPCDVITLDGRAAWEVRTRLNFDWDPTRFPEPAAAIAALKQHDLRVCVWEYPYVSVHNPAFAELAAKGWLLKRENGEPYVFDWVKDPDDDPFGGVLTPLPPSGAIDFTHPEAAAYWAERHQQLFEIGVDAMKTDFGEQVQDDMVAHNGERGWRLHNVYPLLYNRCVYDATRAYNDAHERGPAMVWGRDGFIGSQRYPMQWGGDPQSDWEGLAASIRGALSYGMSGVPCYSSDVGGFYGVRQPDPELYLRWTAAGVFCSHFRYHGIGEREPWAFGEEAERIALGWLNFRYRLIPYLMGVLEQSGRIGLPVMRGMALAFPRDRAAHAFDTQYLCGEALLVAPIISAGGEVEVYFPRGDTWFDIYTGERYEGGAVARIAKPLDQLPVFGRAGHVLCLGPAVRHTGEIDERAPVDELWVFDTPRHAPQVMNEAITLISEGGGVALSPSEGLRLRMFGAVAIANGGRIVAVS